MTSLTGCLDKYIICQLPEFVNFPLLTFSSAAASPIHFTGILSQRSLYHFQPFVAQCNKRLFSFIFLYPIQIYPRAVFIHSRPTLRRQTWHRKHFTPCTANTALLSAYPCSPDRSLCSCALLPYRFLKCGLSDAPPGTDHLTGSRQQSPCL